MVAKAPETVPPVASAAAPNPEPIVRPPASKEFELHEQMKREVAEQARILENMKLQIAADERRFRESSPST